MLELHKQIKNIIGEVEDDTPNNVDEVEERIIKKPKKKRIIYREESDSEEEVIIKPKQKKETSQKTQERPAGISSGFPNVLPKQMFKINFC